MKKIFFSFILVISFYTAFPQDYLDYKGLKKTNVKGKVKVIQQFGYSAIVDNNIIKTGTQDPNWKKYYAYDENGNVTEERSFDSDGTILYIDIIKYKDIINKKEPTEYSMLDSNGELKRKERNFYDAKGNIMEKLNYDKNDSLESKTIYKYNKKGLNDESITYNVNGQILNIQKIKYDSLGNKIENITRDTMGAIIAQTKYSYVFDDKRKIIEKKQIDYENDIKQSVQILRFQNGVKIYDEYIMYNENGEVTQRFVNRYDDSGNKIEYISSSSLGTWKDLKLYDERGFLIEEKHFEEGKLIRRNTYKYDENGDVIESYIHWYEDENEKSLTYRRYQYKYDEHGNWYVRIDFYNKNPDRIIKRKIEYY